jgi:hypothetical protein
MAINFADLAKKAKAVASGEKKSFGDDRIWYPKRNEAGNAEAIIRFLPGADGNESNEIPWVATWNHAFQDKGGWYFENSLTTKGLDDPVSKANAILWNSGLDSDKELARKRKRKLAYYSNILVVKDKATPANEGKVFLFKYGKKIFDQIQAAMDPEFEDDVVINPFNLSGKSTPTSPAGADYRFKITVVDNYANYDKSKFADPSDCKIGEKIKDCYDLKEIVADDKFKSYEELEKRFLLVTGATANMRKTMEDETMEEEDIPMSKPPELSSEDSSTLDRFRNLANMDSDVPY